MHMTRSCSTPTGVILLLVCAMLVMAQISGTHLHLCFDGQEPAASVHLTEDGDADLHIGASATHFDMDVSLVGNALVKKLIPGFDLTPMLLTSILLFGALVQMCRDMPGWREDAPASATAFDLRPPLRGPPL